MANLLYLVHRLPFPPDKGDKVRSYHLLRHLLERHRVFLGTFVDDAADAVHVPMLRSMCAGLHVVRIDPLRARVASLAGLFTGEALSVRHYRDAGLARWVGETAAKETIDASIVFSSAMAPFAALLPGVPALVDFVDVDSAKWTQYAAARRGAAAWLYRREGRRLLAHERAVAAGARRSFFVTEREAALFRALAPESAATIDAMANGVDADHFAPEAGRPSPFAPGELPLVFTGAMDYWPNVDAMTWFVREALPGLSAAHPTLRLHIVGRSPAPAVRALAASNVAVSGTVPDVRPYLQHAAAVVAPLRLARGLQNKVLEAMAMARPVVASAACAEAIDAEVGDELLAASSAEEFVRSVDALLRGPDRAAAIGRAGRARVKRRYGWSANLRAIDRHLPAATDREAAA